MATIQENVKRAISDFDAIKSAIEDSGVEVPYDTDTSEYGNLIRSIPHSGGGGKSAYEIAVENGFEGTEEEWLESLKGEDGEDADVILFPENAIVGTPVGGFNIGDDLQNLTVREIISKLLSVKIIVNAESITLDKQELSLNVGDTATLAATIFPENTTDKTLAWKSDNEDVASVTDGVITAIGAGSAIITVVTVNNLSATCNVTVIKISVVERIIENELCAYIGTAGTETTATVWSELDGSTCSYTDTGFYTTTDGDGNVTSAGYQIMFNNPNDIGDAQTFMIPTLAKIVNSYCYFTAINTWQTMGWTRDEWIKSGVKTVEVNGREVEYDVYTYNVEYMGDAMTSVEYWRFEIETE